MLESRENLVKKILTTFAFNVFSNVLKHEKQLITSDMRLVQIGNFFRRAKPFKRFQNILIKPVVSLCIELSVRKSSRPALAELNVGIGDLKPWFL